ncbi:hypothetical protein I6G82_02640 [Lysinibacillus macroides]|uniref:Uncharacterized protein n=1 Tax=Lysinibacillus macroides TaxID=33935 RepID=A0A0M9DI07_9BACI|nr:hypothetical protein [Lysinibacillus macroides]KOY81289.1 hypothetical protein ADM90_19330 [Lysinibacillus macroides]QPR68549.1 hypothetical protein I6G82_02640 [Lysinibacillus macroides]
MSVKIKFEDVKQRIEGLGGTVSSVPNSSDTYLIGFAIDKVTNYINNQTNLSSIPQEAYNQAVDMVVGELLATKKAMGLLDIETIDFTMVAKKVQDGDTNVEFAVSEKSTPEGQFNAFLAYLKHGDLNWSKYRVLVW